MGHLDARDAALFAIVALALVVVGAVLVAPGLTLDQRASVLAGSFVALSTVAWRGRRLARRRDDDD